VIIQKVVTFHDCSPVFPRLRSYETPRFLIVNHHNSRVGIATIFTLLHMVLYLFLYHFDWNDEKHVEFKMCRHSWRMGACLISKFFGCKFIWASINSNHDANSTEIWIWNCLFFSTFSSFVLLKPFALRFHLILLPSFSFNIFSSLDSCPSQFYYCRILYLPFICSPSIHWSLHFLYLIFHFPTGCLLVYIVNSYISFIYLCSNVNRWHPKTITLKVIMSLGNYIK